MMVLRRKSRLPLRRGFTLVELLITVSIIAIMATMVLFAMFQAQDAARAQRTRTLIAKLNNIIMQRYDDYRTRRIPYQFPPLKNPGANAAVKKAYYFEIARARLDCLHDLMRLEMPDRWSDVTEDPVAPFNHGLPTTTMDQYTQRLQRPPISQSYLAKHTALNPSGEFQNAECLYMIVMEFVAREGDARDVFKATDIADTDSDGAPEFVDAWGQPIRFLRWAPGYRSDLQMFGDIQASLVTPSGSSVELRFPGNRFRPNGNFVGGAIGVIDPNATDSTKNVDPQRMARITGYQHTGTDAIFTCTTPTGTPFGGSPPAANTESLVFMHQDPFDPRGIYPDYSAISRPTFLTLPLIYSSGPDRCYGIASDFSGGGLNYTSNRLNPCVVPTSGPMIGGQGNFTSELRYTPSGWIDNITNHEPNAR